jgi:hypothetical protein
MPIARHDNILVVNLKGDNMKKSMMLLMILATVTAACSSSSESSKKGHKGHHMEHLTEQQRECVRRHKRANCPKINFETEGRSTEARECKRAAFKACNVEMPERNRERSKPAPAGK